MRLHHQRELFKQPTKMLVKKVVPLLLPAYGSNILLRHRRTASVYNGAIRCYTSSSNQTEKSKNAAAGTPLPTPPPQESSLKLPSVSTKPNCPPSSTVHTKHATPSSGASSSPSKHKLSRETMRQNVNEYIFPRYFDYVKNYDKVLEKNFPSAVKVYRVFFDGVKDFYADMKRYLKISRIVHDSPKGLKALNRKELELYMQMPRDMVKVAPALIGSSLPMVGYAIFPLVFMYPRSFLTTHFWSLQQRSEFQQQKMLERLICNRPVFRLLQEKQKLVREHERFPELKNILGLIGSGFHPSVELLLEIKDIFAKPPYNLISLSGKHIKLLSQMHGVPGLFKRFRLTEHAFLVHHMDLAIGREGGVHNMNPDAMRHSCYIRGLNPTNLNNEEIIDWLRNWIKISTSIGEEHISLFLHLPLFLAYNHPNNWQLVYGSKSNRQPVNNVTLDQKV